MPAGAELWVSLDEFSEDLGHVQIAHVQMDLGEQQVPVDFTLPYAEARVRDGVEYGVRAEIRVDDQTWFESDAHAMVIHNGITEVEITLVGPVDRSGPDIYDRVWRLVELNGEPVEFGERFAYLRFDADGSRLNGNTGVNQFSGRYRAEFPSVQIDPGPMTLMAGSPEQMRIEMNFLRVLELTNRLEFFEGEVSLMRGDRVLARFFAEES